jgi:hypothetical protein
MCSMLDDLTSGILGYLGEDLHLSEQELAHALVSRND